MNIKINADDYGLNKKRTDAIIESFKQGLIDTTTILSNVDEDNFTYAVNSIKQNGYEDRVGIHLCITSGKPLTKEMAENKFFCDDNGYFKKKKSIRFISKKNKEALYKELDEQIKRLEKEGIIIDHADSHHHIHTFLGYTSTFIKVLKNHHISKLRISRNIGEIFFIKKIYKHLFNHFILNVNTRYTDYFGTIYDIPYIKDTYKNIEIMCHPDIGINGEIIEKNTNYILLSKAEIVKQAIHK